MEEQIELWSRNKLRQLWTINKQTFVKRVMQKVQSSRA